MRIKFKRSRFHRKENTREVLLSLTVEMREGEGNTGRTYDLCRYPKHLFYHRLERIVR